MNLITKAMFELQGKNVELLTYSVETAKEYLQKSKDDEDVFWRKADMGTAYRSLVSAAYYAREGSLHTYLVSMMCVAHLCDHEPIYKDLCSDVEEQIDFFINKYGLDI